MLALARKKRKILKHDSYSMAMGQISCSTERISISGQCRRLAFTDPGTVQCRSLAYCCSFWCNVDLLISCMLNSSLSICRTRDRWWLSFRPFTKQPRTY